jgi:tetratricopeptide (TPR) repeat protein/predicted Ser/Thr protein kinase
MNEPPSSLEDSLSVEACLRLDALCERFEGVWIAGRRPRLEELLAETEGAERAALLHELLLLDLDYRRRRGEEPTPREYEERFPDDVALVRAAFTAAPPSVTLTAPPRESPPDSRCLLPPRAAHDALTTPELTVPRKPASEAQLPGGPFPRVPGYEILEELGRGGMGIVYKARQTSLKRLAALKMILSGAYAAPQEVLRFRTEAEAIARLCHPHIVQVYEVGEHEDRPYFSMEYVDGSNLATRLRESLPEPKEAARLTETLARAVHAMHSCQVIHRDLKPANVLLTADGRPKVTDFGLAKKLDEDTGQTQPGMVMGTPSYMAPEQAEGRGADVGPHTDVYSLGAVLYECLTGRPPFRAATRQQTLRQVIDKEPIAPRQLNPVVPRDLEIIGLKCLQKDPGRRYASALELADDLRRYLEDRPIQARPLPRSERAIKWARSRPTQAALACAILLAVVGGLVGVTYYALYKGKEADLLRKETDQLARQVQLRTKIDSLVRSADQAESEGRLDDAREDLEKALLLLGAEPGPADDQLRHHLAQRHDHIDRRVQAKRDRNQLTERIARFEKSRREMQHHTISFADRDPEAARAVVRREAAAALAEFGFSVGDTPGDTGKRLETYRGSFVDAREADGLAAECYEVLLAWAEAEDAPPKALHLLDMAAAVAAAHHIPAPQAFHLRRAHQLALLGRNEEASTERDLAAGIVPESALDLFLAALEAYRQGEVTRSATLCDRVLQHEPRHFWAHYLLALCHLHAGRWLAARDGLTDCLRDRPEFFWPYLFRAAARGGLRDFRGAESDFNAVLGKVGDDPLGLWLLRTIRGAMRVQEQRWSEAATDLEEAVRSRPDAVGAYVTLAQTYAGRKDYDGAVAILGRALQHRPDDPELYHTRAQMHLLRRDAPAARADFEQAISRERSFPSAAHLLRAVLCVAPPRDPHEPRAQAALRLANDHVQLAHLQHQSKEYATALISCAMALLVWPDYPPAHYQRAETLIAVKNYAAAGTALDRYLRRAAATAEVYQARALIHGELHEYLKAIEAYDQAARLRPDTRSLTLCGWAYLKLDAPRPALTKFEAALALQATNADALCGRGMAHLWLGDGPQAVADIEAALRLRPHDPEFLLQAACIHAQASRLLEARGGAMDRRAAQWREQAVARLRALMNEVTEEKRRAFWHDRIESEKALAPVLRSEGYLELARVYGR